MAISNQQTKNLATRLQLLISALLFGAVLGIAGGYLFEKSRLPEPMQPDFQKAVSAKALEIGGFCKPSVVPLFQRAEWTCQWFESLKPIAQLKPFLNQVDRVFTVWPSAGAGAGLALLLLLSALLSPKSKGEK